MDTKADSATGTEPLQFERAEFADSTPQSQCTFCQQPLASLYFDINGVVVCARCKENVLAAFEGGSGLERLARAVGLGLGAAVAGGGLYYAVSALTGYNLGIISVLVGWMVGAAVFHGSSKRGGWLYQLVAVVLAYLAIGASLVPEVLSQAEVGATQASRVFTALTITLTGPVLVGMESLLSGLIYAFALYEAWRRNKRTVIAVSGPFQVSTAGVQGATMATAAPVQVVGHGQRE